MEKVILISQGVVADLKNRKLHSDVIDELNKLDKAGCSIACLSRLPEPSWWSKHCKFIKYIPRKDKRNGKAVKQLLASGTFKGESIKHSDVIILGENESDFLMAVHSQTILFQSSWSKTLHEKVKKYGFHIKINYLSEMLSELENKHPWFFRGKYEDLWLYSSVQANTKGYIPEINKSIAQEHISAFKEGVKQYYKEFNLHFLSSIYATKSLRKMDYWSLFPSSDSSISFEDQNIHTLCNFVRCMMFNRYSQPVFIRHKTASVKRAYSENRHDAQPQIESLFINPYYQDKLSGKNIAIFDDFQTFGVSASVAYSLLKKCGINKVCWISTGLFGKRQFFYPIDIKTDDVFNPISTQEYILSNKTPLEKIKYNDNAQFDYVEKLRSFL